MYEHSNKNNIKLFICIVYIQGIFVYKEKTVAVVVPAYNEENLIKRTISTIPGYIDHIIIIDDCSIDTTVDIVSEYSKTNPKIHLIKHNCNLGVGSSVRDGYIWCRENNVEIAIVMNGDNQMDPGDLSALLSPIVEDRADYVKGNRLMTGEAWKIIPRIRYIGNSFLSLFTKLASGYWHLSDSQSGYTAMNHRALAILPLENIYPAFGMPNDILVKLNIYNMRVMDVPIRPVYGVGEKSSLRIHKVLFSIPLLLLRLFVHRMFQKFVIRDFHPLVICYFTSWLLFMADVPLIVRLLYLYWMEGRIMQINALAIMFCTLAGLQMLILAIIFDIDHNRELKGDCNKNIS